MGQRIAPSEVKAQAIEELLKGPKEVGSEEELTSTLARLSTERIIQEALEQEQAEAYYETRTSAHYPVLLPG